MFVRDYDNPKQSKKKNHSQSLFLNQFNIDAWNQIVPKSMIILLKSSFKSEVFFKKKTLDPS